MSGLIEGRIVECVEVSLPTLYIGLQGRFTATEAGEVPVPSEMAQATGIFLGGCIDRGKGNISSKARCDLAHAHIRGDLRGWICFQLPEYFHDPSYNWLRMHELAHIISGQGHTEKWRRVMQELGQDIPEQYRSRR
jgi:hypothetical protein